MRVCPICGAKAFDDARRCFGCLHEFDEADVPVRDADAASLQDEEAVSEAVVIPSASSAAAGEGAPPFLIRLVPTMEPSGEIAWRCAVELG